MNRAVYQLHVRTTDLSRVIDVVGGIIFKYQGVGNFQSHRRCSRMLGLPRDDFRGGKPPQVTN